MTLVAAREQMRHERNAAAEDEKRFEASILEALFEEFASNWENYSFAVRPRLEELSAGELFARKIPTPLSVFPIYGANAGNLGRITDKKLRQLIIRAHSINLAMISSLLFNTALLTEYETALATTGPADKNILDNLIKDRARVAAEYALTLKDVNKHLVAVMQDLFRQFNSAGFSDASRYLPSNK